MSAKLPEELVGPPPLRVCDLDVGQSGWLYFSFGVYVAEDRSVYLDPRALILRGAPDPEHVTVTRDGSGYHLSIPAGTTLTPNSLPEAKNLVPVESVTVVEI